MKFDKLFTVSDLPEGEEDHGGWGVKVSPTKRLKKLHPHKAIAELQAFVDGLKGLMATYNETFSEEELEYPENIGKLRKAAFELDVSESYLAYMKKHYETVH